MGRRRTFFWKHGPALFVRYKQYRACTDGHNDFWLRSNGCLAKMGRGTYPPTFKCCSELQLQGVPGFLDDPVVQPGGEFMSAEQLLRKNVLRTCEGCEGCSPLCVVQEVVGKDQPS